MDLTQGNLEHTGNDLDLAVQGPGFFVIQTANGRMFTLDDLVSGKAKNAPR